MSGIWSKSLFEVLQGTLNVTIGHRPNILDLYKPLQLLTTNDDPNQALPKSIYKSEIYSLCKGTSASMVGSSWQA